MTDIRRMLAQLGLANPYAGIDVQQLHLDMQGWGSDHHYFSTLVSQARPGLIIEVGTWKGASAITMARHALTTCQDVTVLCVDTWSGSSEHWTDNGYRMLLNLQHGYPALYRQFLANVILNGLTTTVFPLPMTSTAAAELLAGFQVQAELIYIDAGHSEYEVYGDLSQYWALLRPGGVLFGDDYSLAWRGVVAAVNRFVAEHRLPLEVDQGKWAIAKPI